MCLLCVCRASVVYVVCILCLCGLSVMCLLGVCCLREFALHFRRLGDSHQAGRIISLRFVKEFDHGVRTLPERAN